MSHIYIHIHIHIKISYRPHPRKILSVIAFISTGKSRLVSKTATSPTVESRTRIQSEPRSKDWNHELGTSTSPNVEPHTRLQSDPRARFQSEPRTRLQSEPRTRLQSEPRSGLNSMDDVGPVEPTDPCSGSYDQRTDWLEFGGERGWGGSSVGGTTFVRYSGLDV